MEKENKDLGEIVRHEVGSLKNEPRERPPGADKGKEGEFRSHRQHGDKGHGNQAEQLRNKEKWANCRNTVYQEALREKQKTSLPLPQVELAQKPSLRGPRSPDE